ncbi:hypothetical protein [Streptomyces sp. NPDC056244]
MPRPLDGPPDEDGGTMAPQPATRQSVHGNEDQLAALVSLIAL